MQRIREDNLVEGRQPQDLNEKAPRKAYTSEGRPFLLFSPLPYYLYLGIYALDLYSIYIAKNPYWMIALIFVGIPLLDYKSHDWLNPTPEQYKLLEKNIWFKIPLIVTIILDNIIFPYSV